jgi:hypothetical protein
MVSYQSRHEDANHVDLLGLRYVAYQLLYQLMALSGIHIVYMVHIAGYVKVLQSLSTRITNSTPGSS